MNKINKFNTMNICKNSNAYKAAYQLIHGLAKEVRTGYYRGSGRKTKAVKFTTEVSNILSTLEIAHECLNDAPRGGVCGEYIVLSRKRPLSKAEIEKAGNLSA